MSAAGSSALAHTSGIDPAELARRARAQGIVGPRTELVAGGATQPRAQMIAVAGQLATLARALCELPARMGGDLVEAARALGAPAEDAALIGGFAEPLEPTSLMRADLIWQGGRWRLLELNCGSTVGGLTYASLRRLVGLEATSSTADGDDALACWADWLALRLAGAGALVEDEAALAQMAPTLEILARELATRLGAAVPVLGHRAPHDDDGVLGHGGVPLAWIYRLFDLPDVRRDPAGYQAIRAAVAARRLRCPMGPAYRLVGSKAALATLWALRDDRALGADEVAALEALVPRTARLVAALRAEVLARRDELVLKPADGYGGHGVTIGREQTAAAWQAHVDQALAAADAWVVQDYAHPETRTLQLGRCDGTLVELPTHPLWGLYLLDARLAGMIVRARATGTGSAVINVAQGAAAGPVELTS